MDSPFTYRRTGPRRSTALSMLSAVLALACAALLPWLAYREAQRQAYEIEADITLAYAREALHRADETARQLLSGIGRVVRSGYAPCSPGMLALMREIDLTYTYIQAIGHVRDGTVVCSSLGVDALPLGRAAFKSKSGLVFYLDVPLRGSRRTPLMAVQQHGFAVLINRNLPLDTAGARAGASVTVVHLERPRGAEAPAARGFIAPEWLARIGAQRQASFRDRGYLVVIVRAPMRSPCDWYRQASLPAW